MLQAFALLLLVVVCAEARSQLSCESMLDMSSDPTRSADSRYMLKVSEYAGSDEGRLKGMPHSFKIEKIVSSSKTVSLYKENHS